MQRSRPAGSARRSPPRSSTWRAVQLRRACRREARNADTMVAKASASTLGLDLRRVLLRTRPSERDPVRRLRQHRPSPLPNPLAVPSVQHADRRHRYQVARPRSRLDRAHLDRLSTPHPHPKATRCTASPWSRPATTSVCAASPRRRRPHERPPPAAITAIALPALLPLHELDSPGRRRTVRRGEPQPHGGRRVRQRGSRGRQRSTSGRRHGPTTPRPPSRWPTPTSDAGSAPVWRSNWPGSLPTRESPTSHDCPHRELAGAGPDAALGVGHGDHS